MKLGLHLPHARTSDAPETSDSLRLERRCCAAGDVVAGTVDGGARGARVALVRLERRPRGLRRLIVAEAPSSRSDGGFALTVPAAALPTAGGQRCALAYIAWARADSDGPFALLTVVACARPHVDDSSWCADRLLRHYDARHFHIELCEADLRGGGKLAGRVHRHDRWPALPLVVTARCMECWRSTALAERGTPQWHDAALWSEQQTLSIVADAHWARFAFDLPRDLPPAVEARTVAWRYELLARATGHRWLNESAALTPLLHEEIDERSESCDR